jgi:hypothetical protein
MKCTIYIIVVFINYISEFIILLSIRNFILNGSLAVLAVILYGCYSDPANEFEPPKKEQTEKQFITKEGKKDATAKTTEAEPVLNKIEISKTAVKYRNINEVVSNDISGNGFLTNINFVTRWNILGPFPYKAEKLDDNKIKAVLHSKLIADEKKLTGGEKVKAPLKWQLARFEAPKKPGEINLRSFFKDKNENLAAYAVTYLSCKKALSSLTLYTGSSGYIKVWINHQLVHAYDHTKRKGEWDQDVIKNIKLRKGYNLIVVKCVAIEKDWNFYLRLADAKNLPLKFIPAKELEKPKAIKKK